MTAYITLPAYVATVDARYRLIGQKCQDCGEIIFPPRQLCPKCNSSKIEEYQLSGKGEIYTYTVVSRGGGPAEFDDKQKMDGAYVVDDVDICDNLPYGTCGEPECD